jgi:hypothetical protein
MVIFWSGCFMAWLRTVLHHFLERIENCTIDALAKVSRRNDQDNPRLLSEIKGMPVPYW